MSSRHARSRRGSCAAPWAGWQPRTPMYLAWSSPNSSRNAPISATAMDMAMIMAMAGSAGPAAIDPKRRTKIGLRTAILFCALIASGLILRGGVANWLSRSDPAIAAAIAPGNAEIAMAAARARIDAGEKPQDPAVRALVGAALARDVTIPAAIELRALDV